MKSKVIVSVAKLPPIKAALDKTPDIIIHCLVDKYIRPIVSTGSAENIVHVYLLSWVLIYENK